MAASKKVGLRFTINRRNARDIPGIFDLLEAENIPRVCFYHLVYAGRGSELIGEDLNHEETRQVVDLIIDRTRDLIARSPSLEVLTVDNHSDGPYLYLCMVREGSTRAGEVLELRREVESLQEQIHFYQKQLEQISVAEEKESRDIDQLLKDLQEDLEKERASKKQVVDEVTMLQSTLLQKEKEAKSLEKKLGENLDLNVVIGETILDPELFYSLADKIDWPDLAEEMAKRKIGTELNPTFSYLADYVDDAMLELDPWFKQTLRRVVPPVHDYLLQMSPTLQISVPLLEPAIVMYNTLYDCIYPIPASGTGRSNPRRASG